VGITQSLEQSPLEVLDAKDYISFPGPWTGHVHMMDPGYPDREDFITGSRAAAKECTTVIDHHNRPTCFWKGRTPGEEGLSRKPSIVDFGLLGGLTGPMPVN